MKSKLISFAFLFVAALISCKKPVGETIHTPDGKWELVSMYKNDYYGGPFYWTNNSVANGAAIEFTTDGKYYRRENNQSNFRFVGTYSLVGSNEIRIVPFDEPGQSVNIEYSFDEEGKLVLSTGQTEGVIKEKFKTAN
jgi:hypothetical protein